jgi:hypothetical protein
MSFAALLERTFHSEKPHLPYTVFTLKHQINDRVQEDNAQ